MGADSDHKLIGKRMRKTLEIVTFSDLVALSDSSARNIKPITIGALDFYELTAPNREPAV